VKPSCARWLAHEEALDILIIEDVEQDARSIEAELRGADVDFRSRRVQSREGFLRELGQPARMWCFRISRCPSLMH
jgi:hypothetical protein